MFPVKFSLFLLSALVLLNSCNCGRYGGSRGHGHGSGSYPRHSTRRPYSTRRTTYQPHSSTARYDSSSRRPTVSGSHQSTPSSNVGWNVPPRPGGSTPRPGTYTSDRFQGPQQIKIENKYNYHYPGYYSLPVQNHAYPGYYHSPSSYSYGIGDTGSTALGLFLGYSLAKLTTPTFSHYSFYDGYRPRYDHYEVHHYYHNKDAVPQNQEIKTNSIVGCVGDTSTVCPANTTSLCTSSGALMCVVSATSTVPCSENRQVNCVTSTIACVNNTAPECKNSQNSTTISIPCVSNAKIEGEIKYVNNTIVVANATNTENNTSTTSTQYPITTTSTSTQYPITTASTSTQYPITTTPTQYPITTTPTASRKKRDVAQNFCVTIVALPAKKQETEGEIFLKDAKSIFEKFVDTAWNNV